jgi:hypothetical protein
LYLLVEIFIARGKLITEKMQECEVEAVDTMNISRMNLRGYLKRV